MRRSIATLTTLFCLLFLFLNNLSATADNDKSDYVARYNLSIIEFRNEYNKWSKQGYNLITHISGFNENGIDKYNVILEQNKLKLDWKTTVGHTADQFTQVSSQLIQKGYIPVHIGGFESRGGGASLAKFVSIFVQPNSQLSSSSHFLNLNRLDSSTREFYFKHNQTSSEFEQDLTDLKNKGYQLVDFCGYSIDNGKEDHYASIWQNAINASTPRWQAKYRMLSEEFQSVYIENQRSGFKLVKLSAYYFNRKVNFAALWQRPQLLEIDSISGFPVNELEISYHNLSNSQLFKDQLDRFFYQGYRPRQIIAYPTTDLQPSSINYAGIWTQIDDSFYRAELDQVDQLAKELMSEFDIPGFQFAIGRHGKLVLAKSYGYADREQGELVAMRHRFRIASTSKPITSVAIMKLIQEGKLKLDDKVFGKGSIFDSIYDGEHPTYGDDVKNITVEHLLTHTCGGWDNSGTISPDPMFLNLSLNHSELIKMVINEIPLETAPGTKFSYSNFGYCLLGRIVERLTGKTYEHWVQQNILAKCGGIEDMELGNTTLAQRKPNEVIYYKNEFFDLNTTGTEAYLNMNVPRMDSHGGWISTAIDLVKFGLHVFPYHGDDLPKTDSSRHDDDLLTPDTLQEMLEVPPVNMSFYAKGWLLLDNDTIWHGGDLSGSHSDLQLTQNQSVVVAAVFNANRFTNPNFGRSVFSFYRNVSNAIFTKWPIYDLSNGPL